MGAEEHRKAAAAEPVAFHIIIVSTSRGPGTDRSGPLLQQLLEAAGHRVLGRDLLPDDQAAVRARLESLKTEGRAEAVITSGGTGLSVRDRTYEAVVEVLDKELPGFGELFRHLSWAQIGSAAVMSRATAGLSGRMMIFALPGSPKACQLAVEAIILPEIHHMVYELRKEGPAPAASPALPAPSDSGSPEAGAPGELEEPVDPDARLVVDLHEQPAESAAEADDGEDLAPWQRAVAALDPAWQRSGCPALPDALQGNDGLRNVLEGAMQRGSLTIEGERWGLYGFPDLLRPSSKVLLVGPGEPFGTVVALHRHPRQVGVLCRWGQALPGWPNTGNDPARVGQQLTGRTYPGEGQLFAVEADRVLVLEGTRVHSWDGRHRRDEGSPASALASLALRWSSR
jgi:molybdenum cofactor biosynthesis protein B